MTTSNLDYPPKSPPLNIIPVELKASPYEFWEKMSVSHSVMSYLL